MKIAFVNTEFLPVPPIRGGAVEEWIDRTAHELSKHDVFVFSIYDQDLPESAINRHVQYRHFKPGMFAKALLSTYKLPFKNSQTALYYWPYSSWCARQLRSIAPDVIHVHNRPQFINVIRKQNPKAKIILHVHQQSVLDEKVIWTQELIGKIDMFIGCSQFMADQIVQKLGVAASKVKVAYNAIDMKDYSPVWQASDQRKLFRQKLDVKEDRVVLYVGRLAENKGVHLLVQAVKELVLSGYESLKLVVCGARGYANREITPYVQELYDAAANVKDNILFQGYVPHTDIHDFYLASDAVVVPSEVDEGFCLITIESMASGVPLFVTQRGGMPEIVEKHGTVISDVTVEGIKKELKKFLDTPEIFSENVKNARKYVLDKFTWGQVTENLEKKYEELVRNA